MVIFFDINLFVLIKKNTYSILEILILELNKKNVSTI